MPIDLNLTSHIHLIILLISVIPCINIFRIFSLIILYLPVIFLFSCSSSKFQIVEHAFRNINNKIQNTTILFIIHYTIWHTQYIHIKNALFYLSRSLNLYKIILSKRVITVKINLSNSVQV